MSTRSRRAAAGGKLAQILENYRTLCRYCDDFFAAARRRFGSQMKCSAGCSDCCTLGTVTAIEAHAISEYVAGLDTGDRRRLAEGLPTAQKCPLLRGGECSVYPARPVICRTHGLAVRYRRNGVMASCIVNFAGRDLDALEPQAVLDMDRVNDNLLRLNLAFCRLRGIEERAGARVSLAQLARAPA